MFTLLGAIDFHKLTGSKDDDCVDRLNHVHTVVVLTLLAFIATGSMLVGSPMNCWTPAHFSYSYESYVQSYCWVKNTYYIPMDQPIPGEQVKRESEELTYYQWAPFILLSMALLFKLPYVVWRLFNQASGIDLGRVSQTTDSMLTMTTAKRAANMDGIARMVDRWLKAHRLYQWNAFAHFRRLVSRVLCVFGMKRDSSYLTLLYVSVKMMYLVNVVCQFLLLNAFMGDWYVMYGIDVMRGLFVHGKWTESPRFPTVTLCDFDIRQLANIQRYTVQCTLPVNMYNDKLFFFLWFWLIFVGLATTGSLFLWLWRMYYSQNHVDYVQKYLILQDKVKEEDKTLVRKFVRKYLRDDGVFLLRLMALNSNVVMMADVTAQLWDRYKKNSAEKSDVSSTEENPVVNNSSSPSPPPSVFPIPSTSMGATDEFTTSGHEKGLSL
ncbi:hypothetical protein ACOMHN_034566 [Nucella lapillus]